jgi:chromosome segregation ATPase
MNLEELLKSNTPPKKDELTDVDLRRFFMKYKGLLKERERDKAFWAATNENLKLAYEKLDEFVEERTVKIRAANEQLQQEITERKRAEEELEKHREHLEELVKERTAELTKANQHLRQQIEERKRVEDAVEKRTDELRTMVNAMAGREVRMAELKEAIQKLRTQVEEAGMTPVADDPLLEKRDL